MIIIGFPAVGKSQYQHYQKVTGDSVTRPIVVDFESSTFEKTDPNWINSYCNAALDLESQGFTVFVSSHIDVRRKLIYLRQNLQMFNDLFIIYPALSPEMRSHWIDRTYNRYKSVSILKNRKAYERVRDHYDEDIKSIEDEVKQGLYQGYYRIETTDRYNMKDIIDGFERKAVN